jgi:hypothetical protein
VLAFLLALAASRSIARPIQLPVAVPVAGSRFQCFAARASGWGSARRLNRSHAPDERGCLKGSRRGKTAEKARYPHPDEAATQLYAWIDRARNPEQVVGRLPQALIAAHVADAVLLPLHRPGETPQPLWSPHLRRSTPLRSGVPRHWPLVHSDALSRCDRSLRDRAVVQGRGRQRETGP